MSQRARVALAWLLRQLPRVVLTAVVVSWVQVLSLRWIDPPTTLTMLGRAWDQGVEGGDWQHPTYTFVPLEDMGPHLPRLVVGAEDAWFFQHPGLDPGAIKEAWQYNRTRPAGAPKRGASTITQQTAKNVFLWQRRGWLRKGLETWYALWLDLFVPKERILEVYLNVAETGPMTFGVEAGARRAFGRSAARLSADQAARLIAVLPDPRDRDPRGAAMGRRAASLRKRAGPLPGDPGFDERQALWDERWSLRGRWEKLRR